MDLKTYLDTVETASSLAKKIGVTPGFVHQWRAGIRPVPAVRALAIEDATNQTVTRKELRPDDFWKLWPDLREKSVSGQS